jgi:putative transcriptional regulator
MSIYLELREALENVQDFRAGRRKDLRVTRFAPPARIKPREVARIRKKLNFSQQEFALLLNTSVATIRSWEQGSRRPQSTALVLLTMAKDLPAVFFRSRVGRVATRRRVSEG